LQTSAEALRGRSALIYQFSLTDHARNERGDDEAASDIARENTARDA